MSNDSKRKARLARLAAMDRRELFDRLRQQLSARADVLRYRNGPGFPTESHLAGFETTGNFFFTSAEVPAVCAELKKVFPEQARDIVSRAEKICRHRFDLLGYENLDYGEEIDWHLDVIHSRRAPRKPWFKVKYLDFDEVGDSKITWELNRHQHFVTLAKAYWLTGNDKFAAEIFTQWTHWHQENPYSTGINWASSLEVAYRSLSWIWTFFLLRECPLFGPELRRRWQAALRLNGRHIETYLSTYFSPNTHLLGEALALFFLGTLFSGLAEAARWQRKGWEILQREAAKQVRPDGFYFEQSTYYHVYAVDIFLHARILGALNGVPITREFEEILQRMLNALLLLGRAGVPLSMGDDDGGRLFDPARNRAEHMLDPLATGAVLYQRGDFKFLAGAPREETLWLLGAKGLVEFDCLPGKEPLATSTALVESGFYLMADAPSQQQWLIDAGPLGAGSGGHGHADALSLSLVRNGRSLLIDPGTFEYVGISGERSRLRGTYAHNTMQIDGRDQSESAGPFSWENSPNTTVERWITGQQFDLFQGSHDGYCRLPSPVIHRRWVVHRKGQFCLVRDLADGSGPHQLDIAWHIGPILSPAPNMEYLFSDERASLALLAAEDHGWSQGVHRDHCSPAYGCKEQLNVVHFSAQAALPAEFATLLIVDEKPQTDYGKLVRKGESTSVCSYFYSSPRHAHLFFFAREAGPWTLAEWASDASFLWWSFEREQELYSLVLCNGSYAEAGGRRVLSCQKRVGYAEVLSSAAKVNLFSSEPEHVTLQLSLNRVWGEANLVYRDPKGVVE